MQQIADHPMTFDAVKAVPAVGVSASYFWNITLPDFIQICTAIYAFGLACQMAVRAYRWYKARRAGNSDQ